MKIVILDSLAIGEDLDLSLFADLGELVIHKTTANEEVAERIEDCDVVITNKLKLNKSNLYSAKNLKLICVTATGFDNIDVEYAKDRGIGVCNVVGYSTNNVAQITVGLVLDLINKTTQFRGSVSSGEYTERGVANILAPTYHEIDGLKWGIIGFGNIGKRVGTIAEALGCRVLVNKRTPIDGWECVDFDTICREADILSIHTPLNGSTRNLLDEAHIRMLKGNAIVINVARGAVTDERALADAIREGRIGGLGVDVCSVEPFGAEHPFSTILDYPNVCLTPHMAWGGYETRERLLEEVAENIGAYLCGERRNRVD